MTVRLEHANITVRDVDRTIAFLCTAFPSFRVRHAARKANGARWAHVGDEAVYVSLEEGTDDPDPREPYGTRPGLNHLGFVVDDAESIRARLAAAGYEDTTPPNDHPHRRRVYFACGDLELELVEYTSALAAERNDYDLV